MNDQTNSGKTAQKIKLPPLLIIVHTLAMIGIGLSMAELFPKHGQPLGLMSIQSAWYVLYVSAPLAMLCMIQLFRVIRRERSKMKLK